MRTQAVAPILFPALALCVLAMPYPAMTHPLSAPGKAGLNRNTVRAVPVMPSFQRATSMAAISRKEAGGRTLAPPLPGGPLAYDAKKNAVIGGTTMPPKR